MSQLTWPPKDALNMRVIPVGPQAPAPAPPTLLLAAAMLALERPRSTVVREEPLPAAEDDRLDHHSVLVDEVVGDELRREVRAAHHLDGVAGTITQITDRAERVLRRQQRRVGPVEVVL